MANAQTRRVGNKKHIALDTRDGCCVRMPLLVYVLSVPTKVAVGTDLFEVVISASYGTISHAINGNVDIMIALVMHTGAAVGAQIGAS